MNPKQKKLIWIAGIAVAIWYLSPIFINTARQQTIIRQQQAAIVARAQAAKAAQQAAQAAPAPPLATPTPAQQANNLFGVWQGMGIIDRLGNCNMKLELRSSPEPGQITGYPVMVCVQIPIISSGPKTLAQFTPASAVLTGKPGDKSVDFTVDKITSKGGGLCSFTSFTVTPFGTDQLSAEWKQDQCESGQMLLKRIGR
jgi:hypothetical protein